MKAYGVKRQEKGCCPGHDKFDGAYKNTPRGKVKKIKQKAKKRARQTNKKLGVI